MFAIPFQWRIQKINTNRPSLSHFGRNSDWCTLQEKKRSKFALWYSLSLVTLYMNFSMKSMTPFFFTVLSVSKVLNAKTFSNVLNFEMERDTERKS